jgi:hypothetical protein
VMTNEYKLLVLKLEFLSTKRFRGVCCWLYQFALQSAVPLEVCVVGFANEHFTIKKNPLEARAVGFANAHFSIRKNTSINKHGDLEI